MFKLVGSTFDFVSLILALVPLVMAPVDLDLAQVDFLGCSIPARLVPAELVGGGTLPLLIWLWAPPSAGHLVGGSSTTGLVVGSSTSDLVGAPPLLIWCWAPPLVIWWGFY